MTGTIPVRAADTCLDEVTFATTLAAAHVPHPATVRSAEKARAIPGPWVVKPARGRNSRNVVFVDDPEDLDHAFAIVPDAIAQTRLAGFEFTADALVARDGSGTAPADVPAECADGPALHRGLLRRGRLDRHRPPRDGCRTVNTGPRTGT